MKPNQAAGASPLEARRSPMKTPNAVTHECPKCHTQQFAGECAHCATKAELAQRKPTHTPTPWKTYHEWVILDSTGRTVAEVVGQLDNEERKANAAFIVKAVNAHGELLRRLKLTAQSFHHQSNHGGYSKECEVVVCRQNYEAIRRAEGGV